ncbi:CAP domain-containing protein [Yoonia sp.]|uniref:CAP domain-containing protein n=1 Tax=Yoonia sp. TaxID=2212373 RepID=UPI0019F3D4DF|nr:CAP domain-containing protein [Yoonia sp.]MBE0412511.1 CAP domain-containing protein [Yoonia sp.]
MRRMMAVLYLVAMAACGAVSSMDEPVSASFAADLNTFRNSQGQGAVTPDRRLQRAALAHANDMVQRDYFAHQSPDGGRMSDRIAASGYRACAAAENIAFGQKTEAAVFAAWRESAGHRRNLLGSAYAHYGLGRSGDTWVLVLARSC